MTSALLVGCASSDQSTASDDDPTSADGPLRGPEAGGGQGITNLASRPGVPYPYGSFRVCMPERGVATLTDIEAVRTSGPLRIDRIGIAEFDRDTAGGHLAPESTLPARYQAVDGHRVERRCGAAGYTEVAIQVTRVAAGDALVDGFVASYTVGGHAYTDYWPIELTLCDPDTPPTAEPCRRAG